MSAPQQHTGRLSSDAFAVSPHERDPKFPLRDNQEFKPNGLPYNTSLEVGNSTVCSGLGLSTRPDATIEPHTHIAYYGGELLTDDDVSERYGDVKPRYVMRICDDRLRAAVTIWHLLAVTSTPIPNTTMLASCHVLVTPRPDAIQHDTNLQCVLAL